MAKGEGKPPTANPIATPWKPPGHGRLAINVDASVGGCEGLSWQATRWGENMPPQVAECKALVWVAGLAVKHGWKEVDWRSDAKFIIDQKAANSDPEVWETRNEILLLHQFCRELNGWTFAWVSRSENVCADLSAKWARVSNCNIELCDQFAVFLPPSVLECISFERGLIPLSL